MRQKIIVFRFFYNMFNHSNFFLKMCQTLEDRTLQFFLIRTAGKWIHTVPNDIVNTLRHIFYDMATTSKILRSTLYRSTACLAPLPPTYIYLLLTANDASNRASSRSNLHLARLSDSVTHSKAWCDGQTLLSIWKDMWKDYQLYSACSVHQHDCNLVK